MNEPLKSVMRHRPPQPMRLVSVPVDVTGGAPGAIHDSTLASQTPSDILRMACSGPGLGRGGMPAGAPAAGLSCARARPATPSTSVQTARYVPSFFTHDLLFSVHRFSPLSGGEARGRPCERRPGRAGGP